MAHSMLNPQVHASLDSTARIAAGNPHLGGAAAGASATATRQSGKLLLNQILNHVTRRGPFLGNSAGVLAMTYNLMNAYVSQPWVDLWARGLIGRSMEAWTPVPSTMTPYASGFLAGALFRSTKGPKSMAIAGTLVMGVAAAWQGIKPHI
jgi:mitochondrial import inner membrane translocase subunit TIM23